MPKVHIHPTLDEGPDPGRGGIHRVIVGQYATLPAAGWEIAANPDQADVIACHVEIPEAFLRLYPEKPFIVHNHGLYWTEYEWKARWCYTVNQQGLTAIRAADRVTAVSEWTAQAIRRATMRPVDVVYHGVSTEEWTPHESPSDYVLWNKTRIDPVCDPAPLDQLARELPRQQFVTTFSHDPSRSNVVVTGTLPYEEAKNYVRRAGAYLCTTRETFGIGTLEALAAGVPVVGYDIGGQRELIEHGVDGWLVHPDDIEGLAEGIAWALDGREEIGQRCIEKAKRFPVERAGEQYARVYGEALHSRVERSYPRWAGSEPQEPDDPPPKVSVIITAYNLAAYLPAAIESVQAQTMQEWELIVVDDASPDDCYEIAMRYAAEDRRIHVIKHTTNRYLAAARNTGIEYASGRYVMPLDADDRLAPRTLQVLSDALDEDRHAHIAYGNVRFFQQDQETPMVYAGAQQRGHEDGHSGWPVPFRTEWMMRGPGQLLPYCSMFRYEVWSQTGGYRERCRSSEDQDFFLRASSYGFVPKMVTTMDTLLYTVREGSMSSSEAAGHEEHRGWYPWAGDTGDLALIPGGAVIEGKPLGTMPMPSHDPTWVTVVIPVGPGHGVYVHDSVDSVDAQTFRDWECIVINDSGEPLPNLPSWVRVLCSDPACPDQDGDPCHSLGPAAEPWPRGRGVAVARNKAIRASRSPAFLPLDADDYLQPKAIEQMFAATLANDKAIVYSDFWEDVHGEWSIWHTPDYEPQRLMAQGVLHAVTALTPKFVWEAVGGYPEELPWEDWAFQIHAAAKGFCSVKIAAPLFSYRKGTGLRRNDNVAHFEESKLAMMSHDFGIPQGGTLMACSRCPQGRSTTIGAAIPKTPAVMSEDMVLIEYTGSRKGNHGYRSKVNPAITYRFSANQPKRGVHREDAPFLIALGNFRMAEIESVAVTESPPLVAARTPAMAGAVAGTTGAGPETVLDEPPPTAPEPEPQRPPPPPRPPTPSTTSAPPDDPDPEPAAASASVEELVKNHSRAELNAEAARLGAEGAESLSTKTDVATLIEGLRKTRAAFGA